MKNLPIRNSICGMAQTGLPSDFFYASNRKISRKWLEINHQNLSQVSLIQHRKTNPEPCVSYEESVLEALCFGWIGSKPQKKDDLSFLLFFSRRKPKSPGSASNKKRVEALLREGLIMPAVLVSIAVAKEDGSWTSIDEAEAVIMSADLAKALKANKTAQKYFDAFPPSAKNSIYTWISLAKTDATRGKRIAETVSLAAQDIKANQWKPPVPFVYPFLLAGTMRQYSIKAIAQLTRIAFYSGIPLILR
jgi:uncharacterized protein YdeI (YjbR/CyaY-like superfamily)